MLLPEEELPALLVEERSLLEYFGPDYYQVQNIRARIATLRNLLAFKKEESIKTEAPPVSTSAPAEEIPFQKRESKTERSHVSTVSNEPKPDAAAAKNSERSETSNPRPPGVSTISNEPQPDPAATKNPERSETPNARMPAAGRANENTASLCKENGEQAVTPPTFLATFTALHVFVLMGGVLLGMLIQFAIFCWLVRRFSDRLGSLLCLGARGSLPGTEPIPENRPGFAPAEPIESEEKFIVARIQAPSAKPMCAGAAEAGMLPSPDAALGQELYRQNKRLREQIDQLEAVGQGV